MVLNKITLRVQAEEKIDPRISFGYSNALKSREEAIPAWETKKTQQRRQEPRETAVLKAKR